MVKKLKKVQTVQLHKINFDLSCNKNLISLAWFFQVTNKTVKKQPCFNVELTDEKSTQVFAPGIH